MKDFTMAVIAGLIMFYASTPYAQVFEVYAPEYIDDSLQSIETSEPVQIELIEHNSKASMEIAFGPGFDNAIAFQMWKGEVCQIHVMRIQGWNDLQIQSDLGHEILHCYGADHFSEYE